MKRSIGFGALAFAAVMSLSLLLPGAAQAGCQMDPPPSTCDRCVSDGLGCCRQVSQCICIDQECAAPTGTVDDGAAAVLLSAIFGPATPAPVAGSPVAPTAAAKALPIPAASPAR